MPFPSTSRIAAGDGGPLRAGVLALQGDVAEHRAAMSDVGVTTSAVRAGPDLDGIDGLIIPGGESTTLCHLLVSADLFEPLGALISAGLPVLGTCAGLVLLAREVRDGRADQRSFGALDCAVRRNGYGGQVESFEDRVDLEEGIEGERSMPAVFIRAPLIEEFGRGVEVLAWARGRGAFKVMPAACRQGSILATTFHPELTADRRLHELFVSMMRASTSDGAGSMRAEATVASRQPWALIG